MKHRRRTGSRQASLNAADHNTPALLWTLFGLCLLLTASYSAAETGEPARWENLYLGAGYAISYAPDTGLDIRQASASHTDRADLDYDLGFVSASLSAGVIFAEHFRAELEAGFRRNEIEIIEFSDARGMLNTGFKDAVEAFSGFANLYYDFAPSLTIRPFLGIGLGVANTRYRTSFERPGFDFEDNTELFDERDTALAWQVMVGASMSPTARTRLAAEYRYWRTGTLKFDAPSGPAGEREEISTRHTLHMAALSLQYFPNWFEARDHRHSARLPATRSSDQYSYVAARFGVVAAEDSDLDPTVHTTEIVDTNFDAFDLGPIGSVAIGRTLPGRRGRWPLRIELEASRFINEADVVDFGKLIGEYRLRGDTTVKALAVNLLVDRPQRDNPWDIAPFFGLGLGYAWLDYDISVRANHAGPGSTEPGVRARPGAAPANPPGAGPNPATPFVDYRESGAMVQALFGVNVRLGRRFDASLSYRYWLAPDLDLIFPAGVRQKTEHSAHAIQLGLRFRRGH